jgi:hypothetical protein
LIAPQRGAAVASETPERFHGEQGLSVAWVACENV